MNKERYIIKVWRGLEPKVDGPYRTEGARSRAARRIYRTMNEAYDTIFALDMFPVQVWTWTDDFFDD
jgi:hypothetical protein